MSWLLRLNHNWGERSETLLSNECCNSVCMCVCVMDRHPIFAFVTRDPYPISTLLTNSASATLLRLAPHNALSIPLVYITFITCTSHCMKHLPSLPPGDVANGQVFRDAGGTDCALQMISYHKPRRMALRLLTQLVLLEGEAHER